MVSPTSAASSSYPNYYTRKRKTKTTSPPPFSRSPPPGMITTPRPKRRREELEKLTSPPKHPCPPTCINPAHRPYRVFTTPLQPLRASRLPLPRPPTSFPIIRSRIVDNKVNKLPLAPPGFFIARGVLSPSSSSSSSMVVVTKNNEYKRKMKHQRRRGVPPVPVAPQTMSAVVKAMSSSDGVAILVSSASEGVKEEREDGSKYVSRVADYHKCAEDLVQEIWNRTRGDVSCSNAARPFLIPVEDLKRNRQRVSVVDYLIEGEKGVVSENSGSCRAAIEIRKMQAKGENKKVEDMPAEQILEAVLEAIGRSKLVEFEEENVDAVHRRWLEMTADYMIAHRRLSRLKKEAEERLRKAACRKAS